MGHVTIKARVCGRAGEPGEVDFTVDTGAFYSFLSPELCDQLQLELPFKHTAVTADDRRLDVMLGPAYIEIDGRAAVILVGQMNVPTPILGVSALEALGFKVNPLDGTLEPTRPFPETPVL